MWQKSCLFVMAIMVAVMSTSCMSWFGGGDARDPAMEISPPLLGSIIPRASVRRSDGSEVAIQALLENQHTVLIFYRGGWCPYCMTHFQEIAKVESQLIKLGYQIIAVSPDQPEKLRQVMVEQKPKFMLVSDSRVDLADKLGIAFKVDKPTIQKYDEYGIDLEAWSGERHHRLPVPAVFLVDPAGRIVYQHVNPDYKQRLDGETLLSAAKAAIATEATGK